MKWDITGPALSEEMIRNFELQTGRRLPDEIRRFLETEVNGGWPASQYLLHFDHGRELTCLHGVYGIGHPKPHFNLLTAIKGPLSRRFGSMWPIGYDDFGGKFVLKLDNPDKGQVQF